MVEMQNDRIPSYNLYGEIGDLPDVVHCEAIATRSMLHDWNINPHRHSRLHQFFFLRSGGGRYEIDGRAGRLTHSQILSIPPQSVHSFEFDIGTEGWVITVPLEVLDQNIEHSLQSHLKTPLATLIEPALAPLFDEIAVEHTNRRFARAHILQALILLIAGRVARAIAEGKQGDRRKAVSPLVHQFETLLEHHFTDQWSLTQYAKELAVTPTHLTRVTKQHLGLPASKLIEGRLIQEARRNLAYSSLTIAEIGYRLGYGDPAYFTRVFTRATGMAPSAFRTKLDRDAPA